MAEDKFAVVDFFKEELVDFVPLTWINGNFCAWPVQHGRGGLTSAQLKLKEDPDSVPGEDWLWHPVKVLRSCASVQDGRKLTIRKEKNPLSSLETSDPTTPVSSHKNRRRKAAPLFGPDRRKRRSTSSSSEEASSDGENNGNLNEPLDNLQFAHNSPRTEEHQEVPGSTRVETVDAQDFLFLDDCGNNLLSQIQAQEPHLSNQILNAISALQGQINGIVSTQNELLRTVLRIQEDVKVILAGTRDSVVSLKSMIPAHPISSVLQLDELEAWLELEDTDNPGVLTRYLSCVGEGRVQQIVYSILNRLFTNDFAQKVNFTGKNNKLRLSGYNRLLQVIKDATSNSKIVECDKVSEKNIDSSIKEWFRTAKGRKS